MAVSGEARRYAVRGGRSVRSIIGMILDFGAAPVRLLEAEQDRWFLWLPVLVGWGAGLYFALSTEPAGILGLAGMIAAAGLWAGARRRGVARALAIGGLAIATGVAMAQWRAASIAAPVLREPLRKAEVSGFIETIEARGAGAYRVVIETVAVAGLPEEERPARVRIRVPGTAEGIRSGSAIRVTASLMPPSRPALPGDYDFARRAWFMQLGAVGYTRSSLEAAEVGAPPWRLRLWAPVENVRRGVAERIGKVLDGDQAAIATALIQGDQGGISEPTMRMMRDSGLVHILSISGLHMALVAGALFWSIRAFLALFPPIALRFPVRAIAAVGASIGALFYLLLSGTQVPALRSFIMIQIMFLAVLAGRPALSLRNVALAALVLLLARPESVLDVSFLMSFAATVALVALFETLGRRRQENPGERLPGGVLHSWGRIVFADVLTSVVAGLAVAPLAAFFFHKFQAYSVLANLLAMPVVGFMLMPFVLIVMAVMPLGLEALPLHLMGFGIDGLIAIGRFVSGLPGAVSLIPAMPSSSVVLMMTGALWGVIWLRPWRWFGLCLIGAGLALAAVHERPDVIVSGSGAAVAARDESGRLAFVFRRLSNRYEIDRWLEHDADPRTAAGLENGRGFSCDDRECRILVKGARVALFKQREAVGARCAEADIVITSFVSAQKCPSSRVVIDRADLKRSGTHVIFFEDAAVPRILSVGEWRGDRPWSRLPVGGAGAE